MINSAVTTIKSPFIERWFKCLDNGELEFGSIFLDGSSWTQGRQDIRAAGIVGSEGSIFELHCGPGAYWQVDLLNGVVTPGRSGPDLRRLASCVMYCIVEEDIGKYVWVDKEPITDGEFYTKITIRAKKPHRDATGLQQEFLYSWLALVVKYDKDGKLVEEIKILPDKGDVFR